MVLSPRIQLILYQEVTTPPAPYPALNAETQLPAVDYRHSAIHHFFPDSCVCVCVYFFLFESILEAFYTFIRQ